MKIGLNSKKRIDFERPVDHNNDSVFRNENPLCNVFSFPLKQEI